MERYAGNNGRLLMVKVFILLRSSPPSLPLLGELVFPGKTKAETVLERAKELENLFDVRTPAPGEIHIILNGAHLAPRTKKDREALVESIFTQLKS